MPHLRVVNWASTSLCTVQPIRVNHTGFYLRDNFRVFSQVSNKIFWNISQPAFHGQLFSNLQDVQAIEEGWSGHGVLQRCFTISMIIASAQTCGRMRPGGGHY